MQKNIVFGVNAAMAAQGAKTVAEQPDSAPAPIVEDVATLQSDMQQLKEENTRFAATVDEMKRQNEELQEKIEQLLAAAKAPVKAPKKKKTKKKAQ